MHRALALCWLSVGAAVAQDFSWIPDQLSNVISYEKMHFQECTSFAQFVCHPTAASCATALCANCPKYYDTCCLQSTAAPENCFQSLVAAKGGSSGGGSGGSGGGQGGSGSSPASASAMPTMGSGSGGSGSSGGGSGGGSNQGAAATAGSSAGSSAAAATATQKGAGVRQGIKAEMLLLPVAMAIMVTL